MRLALFAGFQACYRFLATGFPDKEASKVHLPLSWLQGSTHPARYLGRYARHSRSFERERLSVETIQPGHDVASLDRGGDRENLLVDGGALILWQKVRLFEALPRSGGALRRLDRDLPQRACRNPSRVGKAPHLVGRDFGQAAAAAEAQGELVVGNIRKRRHKIVARRRARAYAGRDRGVTSS